MVDSMSPGPAAAKDAQIIHIITETLLLVTQVLHEYYRIVYLFIHIRCILSLYISMNKLTNNWNMIWAAVCCKELFNFVLMFLSAADSYHEVKHNTLLSHLCHTPWVIFCCAHCKQHVRINEVRGLSRPFSSATGVLDFLKIINTLTVLTSCSRITAWL